MHIGEGTSNRRHAEGAKRPKDLLFMRSDSSRSLAALGMTASQDCPRNNAPSAQTIAVAATPTAIERIKTPNAWRRTCAFSSSARGTAGPLSGSRFPSAASTTQVF